MLPTDNVVRDIPYQSCDSWTHYAIKHFKITPPSSDLCSPSDPVKVSQFPVTADYSYDTTIEVGDLIYIYGSTNMTFPIKESTFSVVCGANKLLQIDVNSAGESIEITKFSSQCTGVADEETYTLAYKTSGIAEIILVATEKDFKTWSRGSKISNSVNIVYTEKTNATETTPATYYKDYSKFKQLKPFASSANKAQAFTIQGTIICPTQRDQRMLVTDGASLFTTDQGITGVPQVQWINEWGVMCADGWDVYDATVYCNKLPGYGFGGIDIPGLSENIASREDVWLTNVDCQGNENSVYNCSHGGWDLVGTSCNKKNYAGAQCFKSGYSDLKLVGDYDYSYDMTTKGILMVKYNGLWGTFCGKTKYDRWE
eukprot:sb/3465855/